MRNILHIAMLELKRMRRNHMVWFVGLVSIFLLFLMDMFHYFTAEEQLKMIQDFALGLMNLMLLFFVVYYPALLIKDELAHKTIYNLLSKPVTRGQVIVGKGLAVALLCFFALMCNSAALAIMLHLKGGVFHGQLVMALCLIYLKHTLLIGFSMLFSITPLSSILCSLMTLFVYCMGSTKSYFVEFGKRTTEHDGHAHAQVLVDPYLRGFSEYMGSYLDLFREAWCVLAAGDVPLFTRFANIFLFSFIPNLRLFDLVEKITLHQAVPFSHLFNCLVHWVGITLIVYSVTIYFFNRKEL